MQCSLIIDRGSYAGLDYISHDYTVCPDYIPHKCLWLYFFVLLKRSLVKARI